jgi:hypothetical protein
MAPRLRALLLLWGLALACAAALDWLAYGRFIRSLLFR